jgi:uncharacterized protein
MLADHLGVPHLRDLASRSDQISASIDLADMSRLRDILFAGSVDSARQLDVKLEFLGGAQGYPEISGNVKGLLELCCQRCLGSLDWAVDIDFQLLVVGSEADCEEVAEPFDVVVAGEHGVQLTSIIEDELISSLPFAPMHTAGESCPVSANVIQEQQEELPVEDNHQPFANLADLLNDDQAAD